MLILSRESKSDSESSSSSSSSSESKSSSFNTRNYLSEKLQSSSQVNSRQEVSKGVETESKNQDSEESKNIKIDLSKSENNKSNHEEKKTNNLTLEKSDNKSSREYDINSQKGGIYPIVKTPDHIKVMCEIIEDIADIDLYQCFLKFDKDNTFNKEFSDELKILRTLNGSIKDDKIFFDLEFHYFDGQYIDTVLTVFRGKAKLLESIQYSNSYLKSDYNCCINPEKNLWI